jgi:RHS repeat-associated protein
VSGASYNASNQQLTFGNQTLTYDLNGNLTSDGVNTYTWNAWNDLVAISGPVPATFAYDAVGRRRTKTIGGTTTSSLHDVLNPVQEQSGTGIASFMTGLGLDEFFTRADAAGTQTYFSDGVGSTVALTDPTGALQSAYTYEAFGATTVTGTTANTYDYTGRESDGTGLKYYRARYFHPARQRFISEDPLRFNGADVNLYAYVGNSPTNWSDPTGEFAWAIGPALGFLTGAGLDLANQLYQGGGDWNCVSWGNVGLSGLVGAAAGATGPGGPIFGRLRYGAPRWGGNLNTGDFRIGWSFHNGRNWFGMHGGTPKSANHWHRTPIPGPQGPANGAFGAVGGAIGAATSGGGTCGGGAEAASSGNATKSQ